MKKFIKFIETFFGKAYRDGLAAYAAQATFFVMLSFFPFIMVMALIASKLSIENSNVVEYFASVVPPAFREYVYQVADEIMNENSNSFTIISGLISLWSAGKGIQALSRGLDKIYEIEEKKNFFISRIWSAVYTLIFMFMCLFLIILHIFGTEIGRRITDTYPDLKKATILILSLKTVITLVIIFMFVFIMYVKLPNRKSRIVFEMPGAAVASGMLMIMTKGFTMYVKYISVDSPMYGSLTSIVLALIWLYLCIQIILYGSEINYYVQKAVIQHQKS